MDSTSIWPWEEDDDFLEERDRRPLKKILRIFILYAYIPLSIALMEIVLRLLCGYQFWQGLPFALFFSVCLGFGINTIALLFTNTKISKAIAGALLGILCGVYTLEYFVFMAYKTFMSFSAILLGAGGVVGEFSDVLTSTIISGIPVIIGFFVPLAGFFILTRKRLPYTAGEKKERLRCVLTIFVMFCLTIVCQIAILRNSGLDSAAFSTDYNFDSSSRRLGIITGLSLDVRYGAFGNPYMDAAFYIEEPAENPVSVIEPEPYVSYEMTSGPAAGIVESVIVLPDEDEDADPDEVSHASLAPADYGYNVMEIDFDALSAMEGNEKIRSIDEYVSGLAGSRKNEYTGIFEGKNLIFIVAEAFSKEIVDAEMTPTLFRLVHDGFYFSDYYQPAWGGSTSSGEFAAIFGIAPTAAANSIQKTIGQNLCYTIGSKLLNEGYFSAAYHNGSYTFYHRDDTHIGFGYPVYTAMGNGMEEFVKEQWPASDLEMMQYSLPQYISMQPFSTYYMTISGHCLYSRGGNSMSAKNWDAFPQYDDMPDVIRAYYACNLELEYAMEYLVDSLESAGIADDTVIVITTDHYPYGLEKSESWGTDRDYLSELYGYEVKTPADRDHSALIIWSGALERELKELAVEISTPTSSLDILPTLCNLFGVDYDSRLLAGRDVFSDAEPLVFWLDRCWKTDLGYYDAYTDTYTPTPGTEKTYTYEYIDRIRAVVRNKINYSDAVIGYDYFSHLYNPDGAVRIVG